MIGMFDSGIGGICVLRQALFSGGDYIFFADRTHVPYGTKTREEVTRYCEDAVRFLIAQGVDAVIIACNTATSAAIEYLRATFDVPIVGIEPAVKPAITSGLSGRILVAATPITIAGDKLKFLIRDNHATDRVDLVALPRLVNFAENHEFNSPAVREYLAKELAHLRTDDYAGLVLGCTHFNYFKDSFREIFPNTRFFDGNEGVTRRVNKILADLGLPMTPWAKQANPSGADDAPHSRELALPHARFYYSGIPVRDDSELERIYSLFDRLDAMAEI